MWNHRLLKEQEEQIQRLNQALIEATLREKAARVQNLLCVRPLESLVLAIQAIGENLEKMPQQILAPVQASLNSAMEFSRETNLLQGHQSRITSVAFSPVPPLSPRSPLPPFLRGDQGGIIASGSSDGTIRLWDLQGNSIGQPFQGHGGEINTIAFSTDGKILVSGSSDRTIRLWDLQGNSIGQPFQGHTGEVNTVAFTFLSPTLLHKEGGERIIASGSSDGTVCLWDFQGNLIGHPFQGHGGEVNTVAFSPDRKILVSGSSDRTIRLWDLQGNPIGQPFQGHAERVNSVAFSPDGQIIISGSWDKTIRLWNLQGEAIAQPFQGHEDYVLSVAASPDGQMIVSGSSDQTIRLWNFQGQAISQPFRGHTSSVRSVAFSPDGRQVVSGGGDKTVRLWDIKGNAIGQFSQGQQISVWSVAFSAIPPTSRETTSKATSDSTLIKERQDVAAVAKEARYGRSVVLRGQAVAPVPPVVGTGSSISDYRKAPEQLPEAGEPGGEKRQRVAEVPQEARSGGSQGSAVLGSQCIAGLPHEKLVLSNYRPVVATGVSPQVEQLPPRCSESHPALATAVGEGGIIASGSSDGTIRFWDLQGNLIGQAFLGHQVDINTIAFSPDGKMIVSGSSDGTVRLGDLQGNPIGQAFRGHESDVTSVAFSPDGKMIASGSWDKTVRLWDIQGNSIGQAFRGHESDVTSVAFNPDRRMIVSASRDGTLRLWNLQGHLIGQPFQGDAERVNAVVFSPDGQRIVSGGGKGTVCLWDLQGNPIGQPFQGHQRYVNAVAFSPDGQQIVSGGGDGTVRLWDLQGQALSQPFSILEGEVTSVAFSADGQIILSGSSDGTVRLWQGGGWQKWLQICCDRLRYHPVFKHPQTESQRQASAISRKYIWNSDARERQPLGTTEQIVKAQLPEETFNSVSSLAPEFDPESVIPTSGIGLFLRSLVLGGIVSIFLLGGFIVSVQSPYITVLCKALNNCARDKEFAKIYTQAVEQAQKMLEQAEQAQSLVQLQQARDRLNQIVLHLQEIPADTSVYLDAQQSIITYRSNLNQINIHLVREQQAQQQLTAVAQLANEAAKSTETAQTIAQYQTVKVKWIDLHQQLSAIPLDVLIAERVKTQLSEFNEKIKAIDTRIEQLVAQAKQRQEKAAQQTGTRSTKSPQQVTSPPKTKTSLSASPALPRPLTTNSLRKPSLPQKDRNSQRKWPKEPRNSTPEFFPSATLPSAPPPVYRSSPNAKQERSIRYANDIAYGLVIAQQKQKIKYGTYSYRKVQTAILCLRRGQSLEEAIRRAKVPKSDIAQLIKWGQSRPSRRIYSNPK